MAFEDRSFGDDSQNSQRCGELYVIAHEGIRAASFEVVIMAAAAKSATNHDVLKIHR